MGDEEKKKFRVVDRRIVGKDNSSHGSGEGSSEEGKEPLLEETSSLKEEQGDRECVENSPDVGGEKDSKEQFSGSHGLEGLILSLHAGALGALGVIGEKEGEKGTPNLEGARQLIDTLEVIEVKTRGNLEGEEEKLLQDSLYQLRMLYMEISPK